MSIFKRTIKNSPEIRRNIMRRVWQIAFTLILTALALFAPAWSLGFLYAWLYMAAYFIIIIAGAAYASARSYRVTRQ